MKYPKLKQGGVYKLVLPSYMFALDWAQEAIVKIIRLEQNTFTLNYLYAKEWTPADGHVVSFTSMIHQAMVEIDEEDIPLHILGGL